MNPQAKCSLLDYWVILVFGGWKRLQQKVAILIAGTQWVSLASLRAARSGTDLRVQPSPSVDARQSSWQRQAWE